MATGNNPTTATTRAASSEDALSIATIHVRCWQETYLGLMPDTVLAALSIDERTKRWTQILNPGPGQEEAKVFVAQCSGSIVGFASGGAQRDPRLLDQGLTAEVTAIYVLQSAQRRGIGRHLMHSVVQALRGQGHRALGLWVLRDNKPARKFYEFLGGVVVADKDQQREDVIFKEVAYAWHNLAAFDCQYSKII